MDNNVSIKNVYLYSKDLHNQATKKEKKKRIIWTIVSLLITLLSAFAIVYIIINDLIKNLAILYFILMVLAIIFFFCFLYNFFSLASFFGMDVIFSDRGYALTNNDEIITFKYERNPTYLRYDLLKDNLLDEIVKVLALQISISKENKEIVRKIKEQNMSLNDLYECLNIVNIYKINEKIDCIEIVCDYIDLIKNTSCKKQSLTIYKYYENWEELFKKLKIKKEKAKKTLTQKDGEHSGFVAFVLGGCLNKTNAIFFHVFFTYVLLDSINEKYLFAIWLELGIATIISVLYFQKRALKYLHDNIGDTKEFLSRKIHNNKIVLSIYSMLLLVYSIMNIKEIPVMLITAIVIFVILFIFKKKIDK